MVRFGWVASVAVALVAGLGGSPASACKLGTIVETPLVQLGDEATVEASINGELIRMLVDTGSAQTLLLHNAVAKLKLRTHAVDYGVYYGVGGFGQEQGVQVREFRIGKAVRRDVDLAVVTGSMDAPPFEGLLGETSLGRGDLELNYAGNVLRLIQPSGCEGDQVVYWGGAYAVSDLLPSNSGKIVVRVSLDGRPVRAMIDSGAAVSMVSSAIASWAGVDAAGRDATSIGQVGGVGRDRVAASQVRFKTLEIGGEVIRNPKLAVGDLFGADVETDTGSHISNPMGDLPDLLIGADFVRAHHIYVARSQDKVYFSYLGGPIFRDHVEVRPGSTDPQRAAASK